MIGLVEQVTKSAFQRHRHPLHNRHGRVPHHAFNAADVGPIKASFVG